MTRDNDQNIFKLKWPKKNVVFGDAINMQLRANLVVVSRIGNAIISSKK